MASEARATVVVADDDSAITEAVAQILAEEGYAVTVAHDGEAALAAVRRERPAVLVADIVMPNLDGIALARRVAALPGAPVPVILMSAHWDATPRPEIPFLAKPFDLDTLLTMVRRMLDAKPAAPSPSGLQYLLEAYCQRCGGLRPSAEQEPTDVAAPLICAVCGAPLRPPIVVARPAASGQG